MNESVEERRRPGSAFAAAAQWTMASLALVTAVLVVVLNVRTLVIWNVPDLGMATNSDFTRLVVEPNSAAERAGLRTGDRLDFPAMSPFARMQLSGSAFAGQTVDVAVDRQGVKRHVAFRIPAAPRTPEAVISNVVGVLVAVLVLLLAAVVVARRRSLDAGAFWLIAIAGVGWCSGLFEFATGDAEIVALNVLGLFGFGQIIGAIWLGLRFLPPSPARIRVAQVWLGLMGVLVGMSGFYNVRQMLFGKLPPPIVQAFFADNVIGAVYIFGLILLVALGLLRTRDAMRARLNWFAFGALLNLISQAIYSIPLLSPSVAFSSIWSSAGVITASFGTVAYAYPILRHDVFGVGFAVNRAVIYSVVTGLVIGVFAGGNWLIGLALKSTGLALPVDVVLAGCAGLSLNIVQRRVTVTVDRVVFRRRYLAEQRLRHVSRALSHARSATSIYDAIVVEPCEALGLHGAAFFARDDHGAYQRVSEYGWPRQALHEIPESDRLVRFLLGGDGTPVVMDQVPYTDGLPHGAPRPRHAFALWSRRELIGIAFYSAHRSGAVLDPQEVAAIERIADAATAAFDRVAAAALRRTQEELAEARAENQRLRALVERTTA